MNRPLLSVLALSLILAAAGPAYAQPWRPGANDRLVEEALSDMGVDYRGDVRRAVQDAFREIVPGASWTRYRLNRAQAHALAFTALGSLGYTWTAYPPGRPRPQRPDYPGPYGCRNASEQLYELALYIPNGSSLFLSSDEQARVHAGLTEVGREANACGCQQLADGALDALRELNETTLPGREDTIEALNELRRLAERCEG
jgi:hypothetical protein